MKFESVYRIIEKYIHRSFYRYRRNKSDRDKAKLKRLAKRDKEIAEELKPIQEQLKLLREKEHKLNGESSDIYFAKAKILNKYKYEVRTRTLNPNYIG